MSTRMMAILNGKANTSKVFTPAGSPEMPNYGWTINDDGESILVVKSYTNVQEIINSHHDDVALPCLIERFMRGDESALSQNKIKAFYDDVTMMPANMHDAIKLQTEQKEQFNALPYEIREKFNNDFNQYLSAFGLGNIAKIEDAFNMDIDGDGVVGTPDVEKVGEDNE